MAIHSNNCIALVPEANPITRKILGFYRFARSEGFNVGVREAEDALLAGEAGFLMPKATFRHTLRALMCSSHDEFERFDALFNRYWSRHSVYGQKTIHRKISQPYQPKRDAPSLLLTSADDGRNVEDEGRKITGASAVERLRKTDFSKLQEEELSQLDELAARLWRQMSHRVTRRLKTARRQGQVSLRRTIRQNLDKGGEPVELSFRKKKQVKPRLVVLLDVSGSMDQYSMFFLKFIYALQQHFERVESFIFSTRLVHISSALQANGLEETLRLLSGQASAWSSGTRIGECFAAFNTTFAKRILARNAIVVVLSDGLDTGEPELFRQELQRIKLRTRKLIWLNPLIGMEGYQPITRGLSKALPLIDVFISAHSLESLLALERHLIDV